MRRLKPLTLLVSVLLSGLALLAWTMTWFVVELRGLEAPEPAIAVTGETAAPALAALGLAGLALVAALAIAGVVFRIILALLQATIGVSVVWSALSALGDPVTASAPLITETTGIAGGQSVDGLVEAATVSAWPGLTVAIGALLVLCGIFIAATARRWPSTASRYQAVRLDDAQGTRSAVSDWDSLSDGSDPTSR